VKIPSGRRCPSGNFLLPRLFFPLFHAVVDPSDVTADCEYLWPADSGFPAGFSVGPLSPSTDERILPCLLCFLTPPEDSLKDSTSLFSSFPPPCAPLPLPLMVIGVEYGLDTDPRTLFPPPLSSYDSIFVTALIFSVTVPSLSSTKTKKAIDPSSPLRLPPLSGPPRPSPFSFSDLPGFGLLPTSYLPTVPRFLFFVLQLQAGAAQLSRTPCFRCPFFLP